MQNYNFGGDEYMDFVSRVNKALKPCPFCADNGPGAFFERYGVVSCRKCYAT